MMRWMPVFGLALAAAILGACGGGGAGPEGTQRTSRLTDPNTVPTAQGIKDPVTFSYSGGNVLVSGGATPAAVGGNRTPVASAGKTYTVRAGDTCFGIATANGIATADLLKANPDVDPDCRNLHEGDELKIPGVLAVPTAAPTARPGGAPTPTPRPGTPPAGSRRTYTVLSGDTCDDIARSYGVAVSALLAANPAIDADCRTLQPGQIVKIP